jgi:hypothetical protein
MYTYRQRTVFCSATSHGMLTETHSARTPSSTKSKCKHDPREGKWKQQVVVTLNIKVKFSLCLIKDHATKACGGVEL